MSEWIEVNMPWEHPYIAPQYLPFPNLDSRIKEEFGKTFQELIDEAFPGCSGKYKEHPDYKKWVKFTYTIPTSIQSTGAFLNNVVLNNPDPILKKCAQFEIDRQEIENFSYNHPDHEAIRVKNAELEELANQEASSKSFSNLAQPGMLIEVRHFGETKQYLIGSITADGSCGNHARLADFVYDDKAIITRYKIVWIPDAD